MANPTNKYPDNVTGKFYVDTQCILCSLCHELAPANFKEADSGDHDHVYKQPQNEEEEKLCLEAMQQCPVEAIGNDG
jgi:ferredoxin